MRVIHVLIVEDEKPIRTGIRRMLEEFFTENPHLHYEIAESSSGRDAYRKCASGAVDILITDIKMPAMSGMSLAKKLVREQQPMHMLAVSGYQDYEYVREMMKLGVYDYLIKPIDRRQLYEAMEYFVTHLYARKSRERDSLLAEQRMVEHTSCWVPATAAASWISTFRSGAFIWEASARCCWSVRIPRNRSSPSDFTSRSARGLERIRILR